MNPFKTCLHAYRSAQNHELVLVEVTVRQMGSRSPRILSSYHLTGCLAVRSDFRKKKKSLVYILKLATLKLTETDFVQISHMRRLLTTMHKCWYTSMLFKFLIYISCLKVNFCFKCLKQFIKPFKE